MEKQTSPVATTPAATPPATSDPSWEALPEEVRARLRAQMAPAPPPANVSPRTRAFILAVDRGVLAVARHWVLAVNLIGGLYAGLPLLAPLLLAKGWTIPANVIYFAYGLSCHQMPERSFFIFGQKIGYCHRCFAIYSTIFLLGLLYPLVSRVVTKPLRWRWMFVLWAPMALDGFTQLFGLRDSNWQLRVLTGALFALSCVWVAFPYLELAFTQMRADLEARFRRVALRAEA